MRKNITQLSLFLVLFISYISAQQQNCAEIESISQSICASFEQTDCLINLRISVNNDTIIYENEVTLIQLVNSNNQTFCLETDYENCNLCFLWEETAMQEEGAEQGCITLSSSCLSDTIYLGCFNDESVDVCSHPCPNDCSGNGVCLPSGICDCKDEYHGDDCSQQCQSSIHGLPLLQSTSYRSASNDSDFLGYIRQSIGLAYLGALVQTTGSTEMVDVYISKSCRPETDFYDHHFQATKGHVAGTTLAQDCNTMAGGTWYVRVVCPVRTCSFSFTTEDIQIVSLQNNQYNSYSINAPFKYFKFDVTGSEYSIDVTALKSIPLVVELMKSECPYDNYYLDSLSKPSYTFYNLYSSSNIFKYHLTSKSATPGTYYLKVLDTSYSWGSKTVSNAYSVVASSAYCDQECQFGFCSKDNKCTCISGWGGDLCSKPIHLHSSSSKHQISSDSSDDNDHNDDAGLSGGAIAGITIGSITVIAVVIILVVVVISVAIFAFRKKRQVAKPDALYDLLTVEN